MTRTMTTSLRDIQIAVNIVERLKPISRSLRKLNEYQCNYGELTSRQSVRESRLMMKAIELAEDLGLKAYFQTDPRGCALYLIDETMNETNYNYGLAIC